MTLEGPRRIIARKTHLVVELGPRGRDVAPPVLAPGLKIIENALGARGPGFRALSASANHDGAVKAGRPEV